MSIIAKTSEKLKLESDKRRVPSLHYQIYLHDFLTALPRPRLGLEQPASALPRLDLILSCLASPRPRQFCLGLGLGLVKTASPTSLVFG